MRRDYPQAALSLDSQRKFGTNGFTGVVSAKSRTTEIKPDFFIVGAPKCGTTAMSDFLGAHPDIFMARKEMHFFGRDLRFAPHFYRRARREYLAEFDGCDGEARLGEASVWYLFSETAASEIKEFNPGARIIVMLREPAEMMYSLFHYFRYDGNETLATFEEALEAEPDRRAGRRIGRQTYLPQGLAYRDTVRFTKQLQRYFETFGRNRVHVVLLEDLAANPAAVYGKTLEFLEVDSSITLPEFPRVNSSKAVKNRAVRAVVNDPAVRNAILALRPLMPSKLFKAFHRIERILDRHTSEDRKPAPLAPELRLRLRQEFAGEIESLGELIGRDLGHWNCGTVPPGGNARPTKYRLKN